ncbi:MAG: hypothetical protein ACR2Q4_15925 [Geminicoccaceae bacterium]
MTKRLSLILVAAAIALVGAFSLTGAEDQEIEREKCIENCG